jgi:hypothetical protein
MPRSVGVSIENNFTKGLLTEVTGANSPENSVTQTIDVIYDRTGRAKTRPGLDYEASYSWNTVLDTSGVYREYLWETVTENSPLTFVVTQTGRYLNFYQSSFDQPLSTGHKSFTYDLNSARNPAFTIGVVAANSCSFSSGRGYLFVAHPNCTPFYISYNSSTDSITAVGIQLLIRDFEGVDDGLQTSDRPTVETAAHKYNTFNQGWYATTQHAGGGTVQVYDSWHSDEGNYPSNADFWWYYTTPDTSGASTGTDQFNPPATAIANTALLGNTPAPKGHYILNALSTNRSSLSGISGVTETSSNGYGPSVIAFYAGRTFYAGIGASGYSSTVYFSQTIQKDPDFGKCYQANDPTSKDYFDLLATDGGTVKIQDINNIIDMKVIGQSLYIFASNGVWTISGTIDAPFKATDYTVTKVSSFPALSRTTIVDIGGMPIWWNYEGIYALQKDQSGVSSSVNNLTTTTIQRFYDAIPSVSKMTAKGQYNEQQNIIYWLYSTTGNTTYFDRVLVFDTLTNAFYPLSLPTGSNKIVGVVSLIVEKSRTFKFAVLSGSNMTFGEYINESPVDFITSDNTPVSCSFITGYRIRGNLLNKFETNYLTVLTEPYVAQASCFVQGIWDYANDELTGRFTNPQQIYRYLGYRNYQRSKLKMRGNGRALQFKFFNEAGKPFTIVAWAGFETASQVP